jgi:hypothetical protein
MTLASYLIAFALSAGFLPGSSETTPVLLELFTSLGCSSCPPADKLLAEIDRRQPIPGARLIVLSEHVDYWNSIRWSDPFSSDIYTQRQQAYATRFGMEIYTPQLVVDGAKALLGSDWPKVENAVAESLRGAKIPVQLTGARTEKTAQVKVEIGRNSSDKKGVVFLALAHDHAQSHVGGGENAGRDISEVAVAYSIKQLGKIDAQSTFIKSLSIELPSNSQAGDLRVIAFVRKSDTMQVIGADELVF